MTAGDGFETEQSDSRGQQSAADELAELTGRPREDFDASQYEIPDFDDQELIVDE